MAEDYIQRPSMKRVFWSGVEAAGTTIVKGTVLLVLGYIALLILKGWNYYFCGPEDSLFWGMCSYVVEVPYDLSWLDSLLLPLGVMAMIAAAMYSTLYVSILQWREELAKKKDAPRQVRSSSRSWRRKNRLRAITRRRSVKTAARRRVGAPPI